ncbi:hypothetical protein LSCM1_02918 [Leishmania martiniquensis]|uniref:C3H1-type domain-containing protein n=1 Tax=Leishmania martiniquensis TaxID=1580590 RepID=A0A836GPS5_9TRYP|nr:hypothetical protein LSCM1_02918 [Leishmania martiniquensis]
MCWWNDFGAHRNSGAADGQSRQQQQHGPSDAVSPGAMSDEGAVDGPVHPVNIGSQNGDATSKTNLSGVDFSAHLTSREENCGAAANCSEASSLRQASTSAGGVTLSDQFGLSAAFSAWDSPSLQQQLHPPASRSHQLPLLSPAADVVASFPSSSKTGDRCGSDAKNGCGEGDSAGVSVLGTDFYGPSFMSRANGAKISVATHSRVDNAPSALDAMSDGNDSVVSGDVKAHKEGVLYDEADVSTISNLIAALQVQDTTNQSVDNASPAEGDEVKNPGDFSCAPHESSARDSHAPADADRSVGATANPDAAMQQPQPQGDFSPNPVLLNLAPVFYDPKANTSATAGLSAMLSSSQLQGSNMYSASCSSGFEASLEEVPSCAAASVGGRVGPGAAVRCTGSAMAPLQLTPFTVHSALASFQSVLEERSSDVTLPSSIGDLCDTAGRVTSSRNGDSSSGDGLAKADTPVMVGNGNPAMRGRVNSVVAHKLNLDGTARRSGQQDLRGSGSLPPASASLDSTCSSDIPTPLPSAQGRLSMPPQVCMQEREASPDSSADRFFAQTASSAPSMLGLQQQVASSVTAERLGVTHQHTRTASEVSLSTAAATYHGSSAQQQSADESGCIAVVDPQRRKLHVPLSAIQATKALNGRLKTPSLCLLYQSGRCRQGDNCYQVHVDPDVVERLRADVKSLPCCCFQHGDCNSHMMDRKAYDERSLRIAGRFSVPLTSVAYTAGLQRVLQDQQACAPVNPSVLCRLHGQPGGCRFAADCRFVHICCEILQNELAGVMANAMAASAASAAMMAAPPKQQQQSRAGSGSPFLVDLISSGPISSSGPVHGGSNAVMLSVNNAASSVMLTADFSPSQLSRAVPVSTTAALNAFSIRLPPSSQQQQSSTPSSVAMPPSPHAGTLSAPCISPHYTLTTLPPLVSQAQTATGRPSPLQTSVSESPPSACHAHVRSLSTQSNGTYPSYAGFTLAQTPSHSESASPMNMALPVAHNSATFPVSAASTGGGIRGTPLPVAQRQFPRQAAPPQLHQPSSLVQMQAPPFLHLQQHRQPPASQQFYVQQVNLDGTISLVPVSVMPDFGGGVL